MSVNVDFDIRVTGLGGDKKAAQPVTDLLESEGLLGEMTHKAGKEESHYKSDYPIIISKSYEYLPQLEKQLAKLATGGLAIEFRTRVEGAPWSSVKMPKGKAMKATKTTKAAKATKKPVAAKTAKAPEPKARASTKLSVNGKTVVITGTVPGMQRADAEAKLASLGARCTSSVSKKTDYVFAMDDAGSKKADAERLGVPVLSQVVLFSLIGSPDAPRAPKKPVTAEAKAKVAARKPEESHGFEGKTVVITGTLSRERNDIAAVLRDAGANVTGSVSANTHYLITGSGVGASKLTKATSLGVTIIDEATMNEMLEG